MAEETSAQQAYDQFWPKTVDEIRSLEPAGLKHQELPLARIKKVILNFLYVRLRKRKPSASWLNWNNDESENLLRFIF
jgi:hypothetical protein